MPPRKIYTKKRRKTQIPQEYKSGIIAIIFLFFGIITLISDTKSVFGFFLYENLTKLFGEYYKFIFSPVLILSAVFLFKEDNYHFNLFRLIGLFIYFLSITTIIGFFIPKYTASSNLYPLLESILGRNSVLLTFSILLLSSLIILFRFSPKKFIKATFSVMPDISDIKTSLKKAPKKLISETKNKAITRKELKNEKEKEKLASMLEELKNEKLKLEKERALEKQNKQLTLNNAPKNIIIENKNKKSISSIFKKEEKKAEKTQIHENIDFGDWVKPELILLDDRGGKIQYDENEIRRKEIEIQEKLLQFRIEVSMEGFKVGPTVIQYRLKPKEGVKLQKIVNLKKDLTLALHAKNIRIQAPIPGMGVVGIEVPNDKRQIVGLKEVLESPEFNDRKKEIPIALGKDVSGRIIVGDLVRMPHLLVAGQTASGKSIGMNGFLVSILYKFSPSQLKLILIDPKRVELSVYNGIPHLLTPVITNPEKALNSLKWCIAEMLRRYDLATNLKARNLNEYNAKVSKKEKLPYIIIVVDELADLMMSGNKKEVEGSIARIAQMARAVGMHLIVATQRPSVDVITGLIKANIPSRIAFTVASQVDSRTVIDKGGAEDLLGKGDMLYYPTGTIDPERVQGALVETHEVEAIVNKLKLTIDPDMLQNMQDDSIVNGVSKNAGSILEGYKGDQEESPEIIEKAISVVKETRKGSTSLIQRKLGLGYARAAKVLDILEELGVVGPANGSKPREVYID
ncbi:hypothetical protein CSB07_01685 [Candidatus Gracilibacteria bacterium]|nr:MAG: hypothetical protein CSB07_01685 [Candidatus Gracilibacteria bacterium]